jgi:hypothetical protein
MTEGGTGRIIPGCPIQSWMHRPMHLRLPNMDSLPELHVIVGRDSESSGVNIYAWMPTGGTHPHYQTLFDARWGAPITSTREALTIARDAVAAALAALVVPPED